MDSKGVSPMIATIVLIAIVFAVAAILALSLASAPTPSPPSASTFQLENVENGRDTIVIKHVVGDRANDVIDNTTGTIKWKNLELRLNGEIVPATGIEEIVSEGTRYTRPLPTKLYSTVVGDRIRVKLTRALVIGDEVSLKWVPKNQTLLERKVEH